MCFSYCVALLYNIMHESAMCNILSWDLEGFGEPGSFHKEHHLGQRFLEGVCEVGFHRVASARGQLH